MMSVTDAQLVKLLTALLGYCVVLYKEPPQSSSQGQLTDGAAVYEYELITWLLMPRNSYGWAGDRMGNIRSMLVFRMVLQR